MIAARAASALVGACLLGSSLLAGGCVAPRVLALENRVLQQENADLQARVRELEALAPRGDDFERRVDLAAVSRFLDDLGYIHTWRPGTNLVHLDYRGSHAEFGVNFQLFESAGVLFLATSGYLDLGDAPDPPSAVQLLLQLASLNYELLIGKFQLNPETGEILLSAEIHVDEGLSRTTFGAVLDALKRQADRHYPALRRTLEGSGI